MAEHILTAVMQGMRAEQKNNDIRLAAGRAMLSILDFVKNVFQRDVCCCCFVPNTILG